LGKVLSLEWQCTTQREQIKGTNKLSCEQRLKVLSSFSLIKYLKKEKFEKQNNKEKQERSKVKKKIKN